MRLIDADDLIEALLEARHEETETTLKLVRFIRKQPIVEQKDEGLSVFEESVQADRAVCVYVPIEPTEVRTFVSLPEPKCADGCIYGWGSDECEKCRFKCEPKRGRWISQKEEGWAGGGVTRCSRCNFGYAWGAFHEVEEFNFCPNCGARME